MVTKFFKKIDKKNAILLAISAAFVFILPAITLAIVNYPASAGLGIGSVQSKHILDGTIVAADISKTMVLTISSLGINTVGSSTQLSVFASSTDAGFTLRQNNGPTSGPIMQLFASTTERLIVTNAGRLGIGTSTPGTHLSVAGGAVIDTTLTAQRLVATSTFQAASSTLTGNTAVGNLHIGGTLRTGNVTFTLPQTDGQANQIIQTNGSGVLSFANVSASALATTSSRKNIPNASTTLLSLNVPASKITSGESILITIEAALSTTATIGAGNFNVSLGGFSTSTCGWKVGQPTVADATANATSTFKFHIRAQSNTTQELDCIQNYVLDSVVANGYVPRDKPGPMPNSAVGNESGGGAETTGSVDLTTAQTLLIESFIGGGDITNVKWKLKSLIVQYLKI